MKKSKENKTHEKAHHNVETPPPPQVMDPSTPPEKQNADKNKKVKDAHNVEKKAKPEQEKLAPAEEL
jgi:hypothetical protein